MLRLLPLLVCAALLAAGEAVTAFHDDFAGYRAGAPPLPAWLTTGRWSIDAGALRGSDPRRSFASIAGAAYGRAVTVEADLTVGAAIAGDWKNGGIAIVFDPDNYWLLSLTGFPGQDGKRIVELGEMLAGRWQAHAAGDSALADWPPLQGGTWTPGQAWHLRLATTAEGIRGTVADAAGRTVWEHGFRFDAAKPAVRAGMPVLWNQGWDCRFDDVSVAIADPVPEPENAIHRITPIPPSPLLPGESSFRDDFTGSGEEQAPPAAWNCPGVFWETRHGALRNADPGRTCATLAAARNSTTVLIEADVTALQAVGGGWKNVGVAVMQDRGAYWLLAMSEAPAAGKEPPKHLFELNEMRAGQWQAQNAAATALASDGPQQGGTWSTATPCRLRLELSPAAIHATAFSATGAVLWRQGYAFDAAKPAVTWGVPALWNAGFDCTWDDVVIAQSGLLPQPTFLASEQAKGPDTFPVVPWDAPAMGGPDFAATGFFHVAEQGGVTWLADPAGHAFFSTGVEQVKWNGHFSPALGYAPYNRNVKERYGTIGKWGAETARRLTAWGFNTAGAMRGPGLTRLPGIAYTNLVHLGAGFVPFSDLSPVTINGFPNVFHPRWQEWCDAKAREFCAPLKDDPWLLGYYIDNELDWHGSNVAAFFIHTDHALGGPLEYGLLLDILHKPADHSARLALLDFLRGRHHDIAGLNRAWGTAFTGFDAITADAVFHDGDPLPAARDDMRGFLRVIADRYFGATTAAIRKADPNHLILGTRFAGWSQDPVWEMCGKYCDVVSVNHYPFADLEAGTIDSARAMLNRVVQLCRKPILLSEWSFLSLDSGLPCRHGAGERFDSEGQRAEAFRIFQSLIAEQPFVVGSDYFMWTDEPAGGMSSASNPEDCSYGLVNEHDDPYPLVTAMAARINAAVPRLHAQAVPRLRIDPAAACVVVADVDPSPRDARIDIWEDGVLRTVALHLDGHEQRIPLLPGAADGPHRVMARPLVDGLIASDRQGDLQAATVWCGARPAGTVVCVANPGPRPVAAYVARLHAEAGPCRVAALDGTAVPQQLEPAAAGCDLVFVAGDIPARAARWFRLSAAPDAAVLAPAPLALPWELGNGRITLRKAVGSAKLLDAVALDGLPLGRMEAMLWQKTPQNQWPQADSAVAATVMSGPAGTTVDCTVAYAGGGPVITEVDASGKMAAASGKPGAFRGTWRLRLEPGRPWFRIQLRSVTNTAAFAWSLDRYYHHMPSAIGGDAAGDRPENGRQVTEYWNPALLWFDAGTGAGYGAVMPRSMFGSGFTIDPAGRQHADLCRSLRLPLAPGQTYTSDAEPAVPIFGCRGPAADRPWEAVSRAVADQDAVTVELTGPSR